MSKGCPGCGKKRGAFILYEQTETHMRAETFEGKQVNKGGFVAIVKTAANGRCSLCGHGCRRVSQYDSEVETPDPLAKKFVE
jgi:hypothetical protein